MVKGAEKIDIIETVVSKVKNTQVRGNITPDTLLNRANKTTIITTIIRLIKTTESFNSACLKIPAIAAEPDKYISNSSLSKRSIICCVFRIISSFSASVRYTR